MIVKDYNSFTSKTWDGFSVQVQEEDTRIWPEQEGEGKTEKEKGCLTF